MNTIQQPPDPVMHPGTRLQQPEALTPSVMVFFMTAIILIVFGLRR